MVERFDVYLVSLDSVPSKEAKNTRPCVVISPDEMNRNIHNVIIAPLSAPSAEYPTHVDHVFGLDDIRPLNFRYGAMGVYANEIAWICRTFRNWRISSNVEYQPIRSRSQVRSVLARPSKRFPKKYTERRE